MRNDTARTILIICVFASIGFLVSFLATGVLLSAL